MKILLTGANGYIGKRLLPALLKAGHEVVCLARNTHRHQIPREWQIRGMIDKMIGGVGLWRGRTNHGKIEPGDALDFWRVLLADRQQMRLLLYAEMKVPGDAWLEFRITPTENGGLLHQTATFRPNGLLGRLYWYALLPLHFFVFGGMIKNIARYRATEPVALMEMSR